MALLSREASRDNRSRQVSSAALGLPNIFEKRRLAVEAPPPSGVEQFGEIFEPLFREIAPARDDFAAFGYVRLRCHKSARMEEDADATGTNHSNMTDIFCGKPGKSLALHILSTQWASAPP